MSNSNLHIAGGLVPQNPGLPNDIVLWMEIPTILNTSNFPIR